MSLVTDVAPASSAAALAHFEALFAFETDCWDVHHSVRTGEQDFVLLDARGSEQYAAGHVRGVCAGSGSIRNLQLQLKARRCRTPPIPARFARMQTIVDLLVEDCVLHAAPTGAAAVSHSPIPAAPVRRRR